MPQAFVTGGTGFLGTLLILDLIDRGWEVTALHRPSSRVALLKERSVSLAPGDVTDATSLRRAMPEAPDAVFHVAADIGFWSRRNAEQERINVLGTRNVVDAALDKRARRLVHTSSIAAYGIHDSPIDETTKENASGSWIGYVRTKALAEREIRGGIERGLDATIVNPSNIIGPYDRTGWALVIRQIARNRLQGVAPGRGSFCDGREVARAHVRAVELGGKGENYLLGGTDATYLEMARIAAELCGKKPPRKASPELLLRTVGRLGVLVARFTGKPPLITPEMAALASCSMTCRSDRAERILGYRPTSLRTMLEASHRWLSEKGLLGP